MATRGISAFLDSLKVFSRDSNRQAAGSLMRGRRIAAGVAGDAQLSASALLRFQLLFALLEGGGGRRSCLQCLKDDIGVDLFRPLRFRGQNGDHVAAHLGKAAVDEKAL